MVVIHIERVYVGCTHYILSITPVNINNNNDDDDSNNNITTSTVIVEYIELCTITVHRINIIKYT